MPHFRLPPQLPAALLWAAIITACGNRGAVRAQSPWVVVNPSPQLTLSVDTSRLATDSGASLVWLRFDYGQLNPPMAEVPRPWRRMEAREALDCHNRRAKDLAMSIVDTAGQSYDGSNALVRGWRPFEQHPLTVNALDPVCRLLVALEVKRGA